MRVCFSTERFIPHTSYNTKEVLTSPLKVTFNSSNNRQICTLTGKVSSIIMLLCHILPREIVIILSSTVGGLAYLVRDCFPVPPTPTSKALPLSCLIIRAILVVCSMASRKNTRFISLLVFMLKSSRYCSRERRLCSE